ncbi:hypothetical protein [Bradyrhizobium forestalis]|uniref:hypothetical protein n=1 Tax=Bradyrhizobium forestalis TaxID=1419263 RepID=UPI0011AF72F2|nr:hypothetical protein [Bradyrhizobium forestalis]
MLEVIGNIAGIVQVRRFGREMTILGLNSAASILRCSLVARDSRKPIALRLAQFAQFEGRTAHQYARAHRHL